MVLLVAEPAQVEGRRVELAAAFARGGGGVDALQVHGDDAGVNLRSGQVRVSKQLLDVADTRAAAQHLGRARMAETVRCGGRGEIGGAGVAAHKAAQRVGVEGAALLVEEQARWRGSRSWRAVRSFNAPAPAHAFGGGRDGLHGR